MRENPELTKSEESTGSTLPLYKGTSVGQGTAHRPCEHKGEISKINHKGKVSWLLGVAYCWGVPSGIVLGFGDVGEGIEGGRFNTRGFVVEWSVGEIGR